MNKIIKIASALPMDGNEWEVGQEIEFNNSGKVITEISDMTVDVLDLAYVPQYNIYVNGKLWKTLVNMPVQVEYELKGESE